MANINNEMECKEATTIEQIKSALDARKFDINLIPKRVIELAIHHGYFICNNHFGAYADDEHMRYDDYWFGY